jgi:hypothetical protein
MLVVYDDYYVLVNMMFQWFSSLVTGNWIVVTDEAMITPIPFVCLALPSSFFVSLIREREPKSKNTTTLLLCCSIILAHPDFYEHGNREQVSDAVHEFTCLDEDRQSDF